MNKQPLVSIIIPVFNVEPYLSEALDSVIAQTYSNLEIIVIDDGSTDASGNICDVYEKKDTRIHVLQQKNSGLSAARNTGLGYATGDIIAFLDPDDAYYPEMIGTLINVMEKTNADIVICDFETIKTKGKLKPGKRKSTGDTSVLSRTEAMRKVLDHSINSAVWNKIYKRKTWEDLRFPVGHVYEGTYYFGK